MTLDEKQVKEYIQNPASREKLRIAQVHHKKLDMHVNGNDTIHHIQLINNFENADQLKLRQDTLISNKHVFAAILRTINKIYSAKGGSSYYNLEETQSKEFVEILKDLKGVPLRKWIQNKGLNKYIVDPNGVFLIEHKKINGKNVCYPTYKEVSVIHDYQRTGRKLEYLILKEGDTFRVYDDKSDRLFKMAGDNPTEIEGQTFPNPWGEVPGIVIGDKFHDTHDIYESRFHIAIELADKYLLTNSVKNVYEFAHGFPLMWRLLTAKCKECNGTGLINGKIHEACRGTGYYLKKDVADVIGVIPPRTNEEPKLVPDVAGYVQPDLETWREFRTELEWLEKLIQVAILGSYKRDKVDRETATSVFVDEQPVNDTLNDYADWSENTEKILTDFMGKFHYQKLYKGSSVNLGRRYMIENPDQLWKKYLDSRSQGAPIEKLDDDIIEYYESKYANDTKTLDIQKKLFFLNEYRHLTITEAQVLPDEEFAKFVYHSPWVATLNEDTVLKSTYDELQKLKLKFIQNATKIQRSKDRSEG